MPKYTAYLANCPLIGELMSQVGNDLVSNEIKLKLGGYDITISESPDVVLDISKYKGQSVHTTDLIIENIYSEMI